MEKLPSLLGSSPSAASRHGIHALVCPLPGLQCPAEFRHVLRATGRTPNYAMVCNIITGLLNIGLDYLFIFVS